MSVTPPLPPLPPSPPFTPPPLPAAAQRPAIEAHAVRFTGLGSEYFRVWIVNVLLMLATLGLYTPFARYRSIKYFYGHTQVAGSPLEFSVRRPWRMFLGFVVMLSFYGLFEAANHFGFQKLAIGLWAAFLAVLPFLWGSAMRFRFGCTRWRGVRMSFRATWGEVYKASWPLALAGALMMGVGFAAAVLEDEKETAASAASSAASHSAASGSGPQAATPDGLPPEGDAAEARAPESGEPGADESEAGESESGELDESGDESAGDAREPELPEHMMLALSGMLLAVLGGWLAFMRLEYNYCVLRVRRAFLGQQPGRLRLAFSEWVVMYVQIGIIGAIGMVAAWVLMMLAFVGIMGAAAGGGRPGNIGMLVMAALVILTLVVAVTVPARAFRVARRFQLVWNGAGLGGMARSKTSLKTGAYVWLCVRNMLLTLLTLGFYRPYAVASEYAARANSVTLYVRGGLDQVSGEMVRQQGAFGDAVADVLGLDLI